MLLGNLLQDVRYAVRVQLKRPLLVAVIVTTLALGIGINTAIFSVVYGVLLSPLPYEDSERLVVIWRTTLATKTDEFPDSIPDFLDAREQTQTFEQIAAVRAQAFILNKGDEPERTIGARVSSNLFSTLRIKPILGRDFVGSEDQLGSQPVAIVGYGLWQRRYGGDPTLVGRTVILDGKPYTVIGILPAGVAYPTSDTTIYITQLAVQQSEILRAAAFVRLIGRLRPSVSINSARAEFDTIGARFAEQYPAEDGGTGYNLVPLQQQVVGRVRPILLILLVAVMAVLLISCANVANLLLARATARRTEFGIRLALGSSRFHLVRLMITESVLLSVAGGTIGLILAIVAVRVFIHLGGDSIPRTQEIAINLPVLGFTALISIATGVLFGLVPAVRVSGGHTIGALKDTGRGTTRGVLHQRLLSLLVISEVTSAVVLLIATGLMIRSFLSLNQVDPGFKPKGVLTVGIGLPSVDYPDLQKQARFYQRALAEIRNIPGLQAAAGINRLPMFGFNASSSFQLEGKPVPPENAPRCDYRVVSQDYFSSMGIPLLNGRDFTDQEMDKAPDVVIINKTLARQFFPDENPIGRRVSILPDANNQLREIVGVADDVRLVGLDASINPAIYIPLPQNRYPNALRNIFLVARTDGDPKTLVAAIRDKVRSIDRSVPISQVQTMEEIVSSSIAQRKLGTSLLSVFAALAAVLAGIGIYGVMAYSVTQRTNEIGIRMAMGARPGQVLRMVLLDTAKVAGVGMLIGVGAALAVTRVLASLLYGVGTSDPATFLIVPLVMTAVITVAAYLPGRRAASVDPLVALRDN